METKIKLLLLKFEKKELAAKLGISRPTLDSRLKNGKWKKLEIEKIMKL
jgi:DNA-binding Xre family transcriptional regulator